MIKQAELLPLLYESEDRYGWSIGMRAITHALLQRIHLPEGPILEVGCGGGAFLRELSQSQPGRQMIGVDLHPVALAKAKGRLGYAADLAGANVLALPFPTACFGAVIALDSFDQQGVKLPLALTEVRRVLRPDGRLLIRVSAHEWLRSEHDAAFNTAHRYTKEELHIALSSAGFQVISETYANSILLPLIAILRMLQRHKLLAFESSQYRSTQFDGLVRPILKLEAHWMRRRNIPFGISLYILAQKKL